MVPVVARREARPREAWAAARARRATGSEAGAAADGRLTAMRDTRTFPIQTERGAAPHPLRIPWALAERAYSVYAGRYGRNQSLARLGERGGFAPSEMDEFLPGWREEADECAALRARIAALSVAARGVLVHFGPRHL